jgi:hypothetical protein
MAAVAFDYTAAAFFSHDIKMIGEAEQNLLLEGNPLLKDL